MINKIEISTTYLTDYTATVDLGEEGVAWEAMLAADKLRNTGHVTIKGYDLNLIGEEP